MVNMIALQTHRYAGKLRAIGETFSVSGKRHARLLEALGRAKIAPVPEVLPAPPPVKTWAKSGKPASEVKRKSTRTTAKKAELPAPAPAAIEEQTPVVTETAPEPDDSPAWIEPAWKRNFKVGK